MSGIYIHGIEIPNKKNGDVLIIYPDGKCAFEDGKTFQAVPVPPHGDLIDRDAYEKLLRGLGSRDYRREKGTICDAIKFLHPHYAPTIIPADPAKEET